MKEYTKYYTPADEGIDGAREDARNARKKEAALLEINEFAAFCRDSIREGHSLNYSNFYEMVKGFLEVHSNFKEEE